MSQLEPKVLEDFSKNGYAYQKDFLKASKESTDLMKACYDKLEILEVEGRYFALHKSPLQVNERPRTDKLFSFHLS